jgi:hypothetical protein
MMAPSTSAPPSSTTPQHFKQETPSEDLPKRIAPWCLIKSNRSMRKTNEAKTPGFYKTSRWPVYETSGIFTQTAIFK